MELRLLRDGNLLAITPVTKSVSALLEPALSYVRLDFNFATDYNDPYAKRMQPTPISCFRYADDKLITSYGFRSVIQDLLSKHDYKITYKDLKPHANPTVFEPMWSQIADLQLRYKQRETIEAVISHDCGRVDCHTGYGKTYLIHLIARVLPKARIDVITKSATLLRGVFAELCGLLPSVGMVGGGKKIKDGRVQLYTADSLHHSEFNADIVIVDENHELATPRYLELLAKYRYSRMYGFSASHDSRLDKADFELHGVFGPIIAQVTYEEGRSHDLVVPLIVEWHDMFMDANPCEGMTDVPKERHGIWRNRFRNELIRDIAKKYDEDTQTLITVSTIEHAVHLKKLLPEFEMCYSPQGLKEDRRKRYMRAKMLDTDEPVMTLQRAEELKQKFETGELKKVIATSVWNRGVNFRQLQVLIRADAGGSAIDDTQIPGRVSRTYDGKSFGVIHDFLDQFDPGFYRKAKSRQRTYASHGWQQKLPATSRFRNAYVGDK